MSTIIPADFPAKVLGPNDAAEDRVTCETCGRSWDDAIPTEYTPAPSARCPFEAFHEEEEEEEEDNAKAQARAQYASIAAMVAAMNCDYDRLEELRDEKREIEGRIEDLTADLNSVENSERTSASGAYAVDEMHAMLEDAEAELITWNEENAEELKELEETAGEYESQDAAREAIREDPLSVEVRSGWETPGAEMKPAEFQILLSAGGPACRIVGELDEYGSPCRAWLEYQGWGTPWTQYLKASQDTLLNYACCFYFGRAKHERD